MANFKYLLIGKVNNKNALIDYQNIQKYILPEHRNFIIIDCLHLLIPILCQGNCAVLHTYSHTHTVL